MISGSQLPKSWNFQSPERDTEIFHYFSEGNFGKYLQMGLVARRTNMSAADSNF